MPTPLLHRSASAVDSIRDLPKVLVVVPCYNEADRLDADAFLRFAEENRDTGFVFVDDGSGDSTLEVLERLARRQPRQLHVLHLGRNRGKAEAVRLGMLEALRRNPRLVGYWDADLATPLEEIPRFVREAERRPWTEIFMGSRVRLLGRGVERKPLRHYLGRMFAAAAAATLRLPVYDTQCGAKIFRNTPVLARVITEPFTSRWIFDVEVLARFMRESGDRLKRPGRGAAIEEVPLMDWIDRPGSKVKPKDFAVSFVELLRIRRAYRASAAPAPRARMPERRTGRTWATSPEGFPKELSAVDD